MSAKKEKDLKEKPKKSNNDSMSSKFVNKIDSLTNKQIFITSIIVWFFGIALWFYFSKDKEKSSIAFKGSLFGILVMFSLGMLWGCIKWLVM